MPLTLAPTDRKKRILNLFTPQTAQGVFHGTNRPRATDIVGVVTKRAIADSVIDNYED